MHNLNVGLVLVIMETYLHGSQKKAITTPSHNEYIFGLVGIYECSAFQVLTLKKKEIFITKQMK